MAERLLRRFRDDWSVRCGEGSGFLDLEGEEPDSDGDDGDVSDDGEDRRLLHLSGDMSLGEDSLLIEGLLSVDVAMRSVRLFVSAGKLYHVYANFEGELELTLPDEGDGTAEAQQKEQLKGQLHFEPPEGYHPEHYVTGDMSASKLCLDMEVVGTRSD